MSSAPNQPAPPSDRALRAIAPFGLTLGHEPSSAPAPPELMEALANLPPGTLALVTGPSGSGKSRALRALRERLGQVALTPAPDRALRSEATPVDLVARFAGPATDPWPILSASGLAEARLAVRPARLLSEGERARLALATALAGASRAPGPRWLLLDEFASVLDRITAAGVAATLHRWARRAGAALRVVCASAHEDTTRLLGPDVVLHLARDGRSRVLPGPARWRPALTVAIDRGSIRDYDALAHLHYRAGRPAIWTTILRAVGLGGELAGVLVATHPVLNAPWRDDLWPGRFTTGRKRADAERLNTELRCIARVVVDPRYRGLGVARRLVETCLERSETPAVEAVAAMGRVSPFFERAGMTPAPIERSKADWRLLDAFDASGILPADRPWRLADPGVRARLCQDPLVIRELGVWARASGRGTARLRAAPIAPTEDICRRAAGRLMAEAIGYGWARPSPSDRPTDQHQRTGDH